MIPKNWHDIKVIELSEIMQAKNNMNDFNHILSLYEDTEKLSMNDFLEAMIELKDVLSQPFEDVPFEEFELNNVKYTIKKIEEFKVDEYIDFDTLYKDNINNLPLLLGIIYKSSEDTGDYQSDTKRKATELLEMPADTARCALNFFLHSFITYFNSILDCLEQTSPNLKDQVNKIRQMVGTQLSSIEQDGTSQKEKNS